MGTRKREANDQTTETKAWKYIHTHTRAYHTFDLPKWHPLKNLNKNDLRTNEHIINLTDTISHTNHATINKITNHLKWNSNEIFELNHLFFFLFSFLCVCEMKIHSSFFYQCTQKIDNKFPNHVQTKISSQILNAFERKLISTNKQTNKLKWNNKIK